MKIKYYALWLSLICVIVFVIQIMFAGFTGLFVLDSDVPYQFWRFVSAIFLHGSLAHLVANLFALALFGTILEGFIGSERFLKVFLISGIVANTIAINFYQSSLGASGAIYGVLGALIVLRPMMTVWVSSMPMPLFVAGIIWVGNDFLGLFVPSNVGNIAHLSGIALGFVFGFLYRVDRAKWVNDRRGRDRVIIDEHSMRRWEDSHIM